LKPGRFKAVRHKIIFVVGSGIIAAVICFVLSGGRHTGQQNIPIRTEEEPIYNHFPSLPEAREIQWCSESSDGMGLVTTRLYIYAFYNEDIEPLIFSDNEKEVLETEILPYFLPEKLIGKDITWFKVKDSFFYFQNGIADHNKMATDVYFSKEWNVIYVEATGD